MEVALVYSNSVLVMEVVFGGRDCSNRGLL